MAKFEEPKVLKDLGTVESEDGSFVIEVKHLEYSIDGNKYPKLVLKSYRQRERDGKFIVSNEKTFTLPIELTDDIVKVLQN